MSRLRTYWVDQWKWWRSQSLEWWAAHLTALYIGGAITIMGARFDELRVLKLNEIGDLAAGVFGPVAFLWLVLGYVQQGKELKQSTAALCLQGQELKNSVEQQKQLASISMQSLELERDGRLDQQRKYRASLRPILSLQFLDISFVNGSYVADCRLFNDGAQVYGVNVLFTFANKQYYCATMRTIKKGESCDFPCVWSGASPGGELLVDVFYQEQDSEEGVFSFVGVSGDKLGTIVFSPKR